MKTSRRGLFKALFGAALAPAIAKLAAAKPAIASSPEGISLRMISRWDAGADQLITKFDVLYGMAPRHVSILEVEGVYQREYNAFITAEAESCELATRSPFLRPAGWTYRAPHEPLTFHPEAFTSEWEPLRLAA
jgi:hypothetical protein